MHADSVGWEDESAHYSHLARANLQRIRGDIAGAKTVTQRVLKSFPRSVDAHALMGDLFAEEGKLEEARDWYELAVDLAPDAALHRQKLDAIRKRINEHEAAETAQRLGLPTSRSGAKWFAALMVVFVLSVGAVAYLLGDWSRAKKEGSPGTTVSRPIEFGGSSPSGSPSSVVSENPSTSSGVSPAPSEPPNPAAVTPNLISGPDGGLLEMMKNRCLEGQTIVQASEDPRVGSVTLTLSANPGTLHRPLAAKVGLSALQVYPEAKRVTLRIFVGTRLTFVADTTRESLTQTLEKANTTEISTLTDEQLESALTDIWQSS